MRLFFILALLSTSLAALAQESEEASLFPELSAYRKKDSSSIAPSVSENNLSNNLSSEKKGNFEEKDLFASPQRKNNSLKKAEMPQKESEEVEEEKDDRNQEIAMTISDVKATLAPNRDASFCSAVFAVGNGLKKTLKSFSGSFTIGTTTKNFEFKDVKKRTILTSKYTFLGASCEQILNEPQINIKTCQVEGWSEKKCKEKIKFIPIPKK